MANVFPLRRPISKGLALLAALAVLQVVVAGDASPSLSAAARVHRLAQNVERAESVRAVKRLQETYAQYSQFGLWTDMAALFSDNAQLSYGKDTEQGREAIAKYFLTTFGEGTHGLKPGGLHTQMVLRPLVNVSADGQSAKGRWWELSMTGQHGVKAEWAGGIFENEYVRERGVWKIARLCYNPIFAGPYATGWRNVDEDQKIVPYHFTPDETGIPVPDLPASAMTPVDPKMNPATTLAALEQRIAAMNDEDKVRNLQNAYGYYADRKMWDDVTDLFAADGALSIANVGVYDGAKSIRRALERSGPAGLKHGQLNELLQLDMAVTVEPGGMEARARGLELGLLGEADSGSPNGTAFYTLAIFENRYVKQNDIWRIREMRMFPLMKTDYAQGWAKSQVADPPPAKAHAPDRPVLASDVMAPGAIPVFFQPNLATGKPVTLPAGAKTVGHERLLPAPAVRNNAAASGDLDARIQEAERRLAVSRAWDGAENMNSAYGDYLDDLDFGPLGKLFARNGTKEVPFRGIYIGRERIVARDATSPPPGSRPRTSIPLHWRTQPVILVAADGRSASIRSRLFQGGSSRTRASGLNGGMYNDQVVLEDGVWKLWSVNIDEFFFQSANYEGGWSAAKDPAPTTARPPAAQNAQADPYPPDIPLTRLGERERGFRGGPGDTMAWPSILTMWFHYKNPVSGRVPEHYWPDCESCVLAPETSMQNHGYLLPPSWAGATGSTAATPAGINELARNVERAEGIRAVKTLQRSFAQYGQFGLWNEMAGLFSADALYSWGDDKATGARAIGEWLARKYGNGEQGLAPGAVHAQLIEQSVVDLSVDGQSAKGRWYGFLMTADGKGATGIQGGVFENVYVKQNGVWKIQTLNFVPQYEGTYETGWTNWKGQDIPITPYHFTADHAGTPVPAPVGPAPVTKVTLDELERRAQTLTDENLARNLQAVYGYYISRRMWDDATDLFTADSVYELGGVGVFDGPTGVRKALERQGPAGLTEGVLNDRLQFDTIANIAPNGVEAQVRGIELGVVGDTGTKQAHWEVNIYDNRFVKENGVWKVREMRVFPMFRSEHSQGWGKGRLPQPDGAAPDRPVPSADAGQEDRLLPAFVSVNPGTAKPVAGPSGYKLVAVAPLTGKVAALPVAKPADAAKPGDTAARLTEVERKLAVAKMYDAAENLAATYGDSLDDYQWPLMAGIFGQHGAKQIPFVGYYFGAERIAHALDLEWGAPQTGGRANVSLHWRVQPVIDVARDGRSANMRTYLFLIGSNKTLGSMNGAIYPMDQLVLEDGVVRLWNLSLNEPMWSMPGGWKGGWASAPQPRQPRPVAPRPAGAAPAPERYTGARLIAKYPPDILISDLGKREEHFIGGTGETWSWPKILPMWFGYRNPVSGREPEFFLNNCVYCDLRPDKDLTKHGYLAPPNGPVDKKH